MKIHILSRQVETFYENFKYLYILFPKLGTTKKTKSVLLKTC